jgi:hypothetical protein
MPNDARNKAEVLGISALLRTLSMLCSPKSIDDQFWHCDCRPTVGLTKSLHNLLGSGKLDIIYVGHVGEVTVHCFSIQYLHSCLHSARGFNWVRAFWHLTDFASQIQPYLQFGWTDFDEIKTTFHLRKFPITYMKSSYAKTDKCQIQIFWVIYTRVFAI